MVSKTAMAKYIIFEMMGVNLRAEFPVLGGLK